MKRIKKIIGAMLSFTIIITCFSGIIIENVWAADNLLQNGGFETALLGQDGDWKFTQSGNWYNEYKEGTSEQTTDKFRSGSHAVKLNNGTIGQRIYLDAGKTYTLSAYIIADAATSVPKIGFYDGTQTWPNSNPIKNETISVTTAWKEFTLSYECTASQDYVICIEAWDAGNVYVDDVTLVSNEPEETDTGIINGSFSNGTEGWTIDGAGTAAADNGSLTASGTVRVSQTAKGLDNGTYNFTAYAYTSAIDETGTSYFYAKSKGHTMASTAIPQGSAVQRIIVPNVTVSDGTCDIGINLENSDSVTIDNISFEKTESTCRHFYKGGEISKLSYIESKSGKFYRIGSSTAADALQVMAENGFNMARIRLLDDPGKGHGDGTYYLPAGFMDEEDCLELARRARDKGMAIEFTIAYSDFWVDGEKQMVPHKWQEEINEKGISGASALVSYFEGKIYDYTKDIMQKLIAQGTCPEFVSIGNEIQVGILFNQWKSNNGLYNNADYLARLVNAGAKAVRETSPSTKIILHSDNGGKVSSRTTFINMIKKADFDVIGVSYYPYYNQNVSIDTVVSEFKNFINTYDKDVIIMETGYNWNPTKKGGWEGQLQDSGYYQDIYGESKKGQRAFLTELYSKLKQAAGGRCIGDLYWDPVMIPATGVGWAVKESNNQTDSEVVSNSTIFDFDGKAVPGQLAMKYNTDAEDKINITGKIRCQ